jgi:uncharacterized protein YneF (UPF0154 family)
MSYEIIAQAVTMLITVGIIYGSFNTRLKTIEKELNDNKDIKERLVRIETQNQMIIQEIKELKK